MSLTEWMQPVIIGLLGTGMFFIVVASLGVVRLPDIYTRMHAATKASTLGMALVLLATGFYFGTASAITKVLLAIAFQFLTAPAASHILARAAYERRAPMWENTLADELRERWQDEDLVP